MSTILEIGNDGVIRALWSDGIDWNAIGNCTVRRVSHVEYSDRLQRWTVQEAMPLALWRRMLQRITGRPFGRVLFAADTRAQALALEAAHYAPGGAGWRAVRG